MMKQCSEVLSTLNGKTLTTAESLTGGGIGAALTAVSGASAVYKGGVISYVDEVKRRVLGVPDRVLQRRGAVSRPTAAYMARGVRELLGADIGLSVTGLAGPGGDNFDHAVGTVFIGYADGRKAIVREYRFTGDREQVRQQTIQAALALVLEEKG